MPKGATDRSQTIRRRFVDFLSEKRTESEAKLIRDSEVFCVDWYMRQCGRINGDAVIDYLKNGARFVVYARWKPAMYESVACCV